MIDKCLYIFVVNSNFLDSVTRGDFYGGGAPLLKFLLFLGGSAPLKLLHWLGFSEFIGLASKVLSTFVHCYMVIEAYLIVDYTISVLN